MKTYLYDNYISRLSDIFRAELNTIKAVYNFDYGNEFEIAICRVLRKILPMNFGICRGFAVASDGTKAGDDIIIYDSSRFPTLGLRDYNDFSRKEYIPIEAIYAYIEAKYTLDFSENQNGNLDKALKQVNDVKEICNKRVAVELNHFDNLVLPKVNAAWDYPPIKNKSWGAIFCSRIRYQGEIITDPKEIQGFVSNNQFKAFNRPDLMIFGSDLVSIPVFPNQPTKGKDTMSYFFLNEKTGYKTPIVKNLAEGIGLCQLLGALNRIKLGEIEWNKIVLDGIT